MSIVRETKLPSILLFALLMIAVMGYAAYRNSDSLQQAIDWERKTQAILLGLDGALAAAVDIESAGRGFVISGDESYLEQFAGARDRANEAVRDLRDRFDSNQQQDAALSELNQKIQSRIRFTERYVAYRRSLDLKQTIEEMSKSEERNLTSEIRAVVDRMKAEEFRLLRVREDNLKVTLDNNFRIMLAGTVAGVVSLGLANFVVIFEMGKRRRAETALREANAGLEQRVRERTEELNRLNVDLLRAAGERERSLASETGARREAEIANRQRDEFMAMVSHELRTPLNSILGWAQILKGDDLDGPSRLKAVDSIIASAENQNRLIRDLLDVAAVISGKLVLERVDLSVPDVVRAAMGTVEPSATDKRVAISLDVSDTARAARVSADADRLRQIVWNLLANAVKFTPEGGRVVVRITAADNSVSISFEDNGVGIDPEFLPFVFDRFRQGGIAVKQRGGLGLGLAIVRYLTEMHGGRVDVRSEGVGKGSVFTVTLPTA